MKLKRVDALFVAAVVMLTALLGLVAWSFLEIPGLIVVAAVAFGILVAVIVEVYRRLKPAVTETRLGYKKMEALFSIYATAQIGRPLPPMRGCRPP